MFRSFLFLLSILCIHLQIASATDKVGYTGGKLRIQDGLFLFQDTTAKLSLEEVLDRDFKLVPQGVPNLNVSRAAHWIKFRVHNQSNESRLILSIEHAEIDELDVYVIKKGHTRLIGRAGQLRMQGQRIQPYDGFQFDLDLGKHESATIMVRAHGFKHIHLPITLAEVGTAVNTSAYRHFLIGGYLAIMLTMVLYNLFLFFSIRDRSYLWYILNIMVICVAQLALLGVGQDHLYADNIWLASRSSILFALLAIVTGIQYARRFINTHSILPGLDKFVPLLYILIFADLLIYFFSDPWLGYILAQSLSGISATYLLVMLIYALKAGSRQAVFFLLAWTPFLIGVLMFVLKDAGVVPYNHLTRLGMPIGSAIEGILLSFGLADRINILRKEKEQSQAESLSISKENERIIREQNMLLEDKVKERTSALEESHEHLKRTQTRLVNAEKLASLGQLTAGIAHEINNPINFITSNIQPLRRNISEIVDVMKEYRELRPEDAVEKLPALRARDESMGIQESIEELDEIINSIAEGSSRTAEIVRGLRNFSRLDQSDLMDGDINEGLRNTITVLAPQYRDRVRLELVPGDIPRVECYPGKVNQVFMNILTNAVQATLSRVGDHERVVRVTSSVNEGHVVVSITDNGTGMTPEVKEKIFDPFFTTKPVGEGTGLGMAIVYGIVQDHDGDIIVNTRPGEGTEFKIVLPVRHRQQNQRRA